MRAWARLRVRKWKSSSCNEGQRPIWLFLELLVLSYVQKKRNCKKGPYLCIAFVSRFGECDTQFASGPQKPPRRARFLDDNISQIPDRHAENSNSMHRSRWVSIYNLFLIPKACEAPRKGTKIITFRELVRCHPRRSGTDINRRYNQSERKND